MLARLAALPFAPRFAFTVLAGAAGGVLFVLLHSPLPWLIGPLAVAALLNINGAGLVVPVAARSVGQWAIGTGLGLYFTPEAVARLAQFAGVLAAGTLYAVLLGVALGASLRRFAGVDAPTAFFAGAIGGASEMAIQGERNGADVETITATHALRVMIVVVVVPFAYQWLQIAGTDVYAQARAEIVPAGLAWLTALSVVAGYLLYRLDAPNAWMIGPLLVTVLVTATGHAPSAMPIALVNLAQLLIGIALGSRFRPGFFGRAPRLALVVASSTLVAILLSACFGTLLGWLAGIPAATMVLAAAPGGVAEMSLTAKILRLGVPIVTSFHVLRLLVLVLCAGFIYRWIAPRLGWPVDIRPVAEPARNEREDDDD